MSETLNIQLAQNAFSNWPNELPDSRLIAFLFIYLFNNSNIDSNSIHTSYFNRLTNRQE